ncbi:hypothetical protein [Aristaeella hokkaidonensis]|uniref:Uncharacterized protein n=1 Tax=Aristaeella hokkaidonensis TaxID=3046382 RepID=A0AC61MWZ3_9FIRM|nr:hypothetical protein [Aristaeella hokkaidonensis]QUC67222.1 hypothetical protein JYE49_00435 [Aristaeella hokkaidonensis]SNT93457.1 hypothetical protein SAMN06297421_102240 [Aristaeella hokkaidonensis]
MKRNQILTAVLLVLLLTLCCTVFACAAEIRPIPVDHDSLDQGNGEFRLSFRNTGRIGSGGYFIAVLYLQDHYRADEILSLTPGDTILVNDHFWTVKEIIPHTDPESQGTVTAWEICPEEAFDGYMVFESGKDDTFTVVVNDWVPVTSVGFNKVLLPLSDSFRYTPIVSGEEEMPLSAEEFLNSLQADENPFNAYNTSGIFEDGQLISVTHASYPNGPDDAEEQPPVWKFCHGLRDGLDTAVITAYFTDCETGAEPAEVSPEEAEWVRCIVMNSRVMEKADDTSVTGGTWIYSFETPGGKHLLSIEMYRGLIVGSDGMYAYR